MMFQRDSTVGRLHSMPGFDSWHPIGSLSTARDDLWVHRQGISTDHT